MKNTKHRLKDTLCFALSCLVGLITYGCIRDDLSGCQTELVLQVRAVDINGNDITASGDAGGVQVYLFDSNKRYVSATSVSESDVASLQPIRITHNLGGNFWVVAWSNLNGAQQVTPLVRGMSMSNALVQLARATDGYAHNPDDLFFGIKNIIETQSIVRAEVDNSITIERKTAMMNIMVKGLDIFHDEEYHLIVSGAKEDTYNFKGNLRGNAISYKQLGEFDESGSIFTSLQPFLIFPLSEGNRLSVSIYKGSQLIGYADTQVDGSDIVPVVGKTNNILIKLTDVDIASMSVTVEVSDWNTFTHWMEW